MIYDGIELCISYAYHPEFPGVASHCRRVAYVSDPEGFPLEGIGRSGASARWFTLRQVQKQEEGWVLIGTYPVAKQPADVWSAAKIPPRGGDALG